MPESSACVSDASAENRSLERDGSHHGDADHELTKSSSAYSESRLDIHLLADIYVFFWFAASLERDFCSAVFTVLPTTAALHAAFSSKETLRELVRFTFQHWSRVLFSLGQISGLSYLAQFAGLENTGFLGLADRALYHGNLTVSDLW